MDFASAGDAQAVKQLSRWHEYEPSDRSELTAAFQNV
jgi:hypothetical protein